jgi:hypothetical protein
MGISREELARLSVDEREELALLLVELGGAEAAGNPRSRRRFLVFVAVCIVVLAVWIVALGLTLPPHETTKQWRLAWIGFDVAELLAFAATGWAAWRGRQLIIPALIVVGTLLLCDAWFDVVLSWNTDERWGSVAGAVVIELPLAALFWWLARRLVLRTISVARSRLGLAGPLPSLRRLPLFEPPVDVGVLRTVRAEVRDSDGAG